MTPHSPLQRWNLDPFDRLVGAVILGLLLAILGVVLFGNHVGVQIESYTPQTTARSDTRISIRFYIDMTADSVEQHWSIKPPVEGSFRWNGAREFIFQPQTALTAGQTYNITLAKGAAAANESAKLKEDFTFNFKVILPNVIYLSPATAQKRDLYLHNLNTGQIQQLTNTEFGIADYAVSPDSQQIAYTLYKEDGNSDIWVYGLASGSSTQLTDCVNSACSAPEWKPDGTQIAYEREEYDPAFGQLGARRVWTVSMATAQSTLLFEDTQTTGHSAVYAPNGNRVAIFSTNPPGILIYDFINESRVFIESLQGVVGTFSTDSSKLVYPILVRGAIGSQFYTQLEMVDLVKQQRIAVSGNSAEDAIEDVTGVWRPQHPNQMAVTRRYFDDRYTDGPQVYLLDIETKVATPLVIDADYTHGSLSWSPDGNLLVMQRFNRVAQGARPEVWLYNLQTQELQLIANDAFLPGFVP